MAQNLHAQELKSDRPGFKPRYHVLSVTSNIYDTGGEGAAGTPRQSLENIRHVGSQVHPSLTPLGLVPTTNQTGRNLLQVTSIQSTPPPPRPQGLQEVFAPGTGKLTGYYNPSPPRDELDLQ